MAFASPGYSSRNARRRRYLSARSEAVKALREMQLEQLEPRQLLAGLIGIQPNDGALLEDGQILDTAPTELTFRFDEVPPALSAGDLVGNVRITRSGLDGRFGNANDVIVQPGFMGLGETENTGVVRFAQTLPDDLYRIDAFGQSLQFELDLGAQVTAVVPQPVTRVGGVLTQARDQIVVYFNNDNLDPVAAEDPRFYQLIFTNDSASNADDSAPHLPVSVDYNAAADRAVLTFAEPLDQLSTGVGTYRLRIGTSEGAPLPPLRDMPEEDAGSAFTTALDLGELGRSEIVAAEIRDQDPYPLTFPGGNDDPGHRDLPMESDNQHIPDIILPDGTRIENRDMEDGIATIGYVFRDTYGEDPFGQPLRNLITEEQKQRVREMITLYSESIGAQFFEVDESTLPDLINAEFEIVSVAVGDPRAINPNEISGPGGFEGISGTVIDDDLGPINTVIVDAAQRLEDSFGGSFFDLMLGLVTYSFGTGFADDLPPGTAGSNNVIPGYTPEPIFPSKNDIAHVQHLYRPEGRDIDLYRFELTAQGLFTAETMAERQADVSFLDSVLNLYREDDTGQRQLLARNDDYFSNDSFIELELEPGTYYVGVSASGNGQYDPDVEDSGMNGRTSGTYDLRLDFRPEVNDALVDATGTALDGDADGLPGGVYNHWFRAVSEENTLFVDKSAAVGGSGTLAAPLRTISDAISAARPGNVVRIVGNGGADGDLSTRSDNLAYEIGFDSRSRPLQDGSTLEVPAGVTVMIDAGAIFKLRRARIGVGSSSPRVDRSASGLQVMGTPGSRVLFTSYNDETVGVDTNAVPTTPSPGDWGGLVFRNDVDESEGNFVYEDEAIFLNYVNHADMRYGGGEVVIESVQQVVTPIQMTSARPTVSHNVITRSADAAMSADPDSFEESNFHAPSDQMDGAFTSDYVRIGPDIHANRLLNNSINGLFVRITTPAGSESRKMTVSGRWDDTDVVHVVTENLNVAGTAAGPQQDPTRAPAIDDVLIAPQDGGQLPSGQYTYRFTFVLPDGAESIASAPTLPVSVLGRGVQGTVVLDDLPLSFQDVVARRIYRSTSAGEGPYELIAETDLSVDTFVDDGTVTGGRVLDEKNLDLTARPDARLSIDPGTIVKLSGSRIDVTLGGDLYAEGVLGQEVVFTSVADDRYGAGGTFDTRNDRSRQTPKPGDWGGIVAGITSSMSLDHGVVSYGGGVTAIQGSFAGINAIEVRQATGRITNTLFAHNADGTGGQAPADRFGRGFNGPGTIFIRGAQPVIVNNVIRGSTGPAMNTNPGSLSSDLVIDHGRSTGEIDRITAYGDNQGALIRGNQIGNNGLNGMVVRGEIILNESVWDDTDIVHVVFEEIIAPNFHTEGGLRLESNATGSLVVKFDGENAGLTASGSPLDHGDRIGGSVQVVGQPGFPVVLTSIRDDTIGAGFAPDGRVQADTDGNGDRLDPGSSLPTGPEVNNGTLIDNDVFVTSPGAFAAMPTAGGEINANAVTVQTQAAVLQNQNFINLFANFVDVGRDGQAFNLAATNITLPPTLIANDRVASEGEFVVGQTVEDQQTIEWRVETYLENGDPTLFNQVSFSSDEPLGSIRLINILDADILGPAADDILLTRGQVGTADFRAVTLDDQERIGFGHGGILQQGPGLENATFGGWSADLGGDLLAAVTGPGGAYSIAGNIDQIDLLPDEDPDLGEVFGPNDIASAFAFDVSGGATTSTMTSFIELVGRSPVSLAGDWRGLLFDQFSNDRNVDVATEREPSDAESPGVNGLPSTAQFLGELAPDQKAGDDSQRLGFQVHGHLNTPSDVDVYSFRADGGTEVWLDIDRTTTALDTIIELVDANGQVIARSDDSHAEQVGDARLLGPARTLERSMFLGKDLYSTNLHDAGMRLDLPGARGASSVYHVRVRSGSDDLSNLQGGLSRGAYQLQIRLQELDEVPGSTVQYADIRNALNAIHISGLPGNSPLVGEASEVPGDNQDRGNAQNLGNVLRSEDGAVTLVGSISDLDDIDWYEFEVASPDISITNVPFYASVTIDVDYTDGLGRPNTEMYLFDENGRLIFSSDNSSITDDQIAATGETAIADLSTGSGGGRDPFLSVMLQEGNYSLAVISESHTADALDDPGIRTEPVNSLVRIAEDRVGFSGGSNIPVEPIVPLLFADEHALIAPDGSEIADGESFTITDDTGISVTYEFDNDGIVRGRNIPITFDDRPSGNNLLFNLFGTLPADFEPGDTASQIASRMISVINNNGPTGVTASFGTTSLGAVSLEGARGVKLHSAPGQADPALYLSKPANVEFRLSDVTMFVTMDAGLDQSRLVTIDPYTGTLENVVGTFNANVEDIAIRPDGNIYGYSVTEENPENGNIGNYHLIDEQSQATQNLSSNQGDDGIQTFREDPANPGQVEDTEDGVLFQGIAFGDYGDRLRGFAIGNRGDVMPNGVQGPTNNLLYEFDVDSGQAFSIMPPDPADRQEDDRLMGGGTQIRERGQLDTTVDPIGLGNTTLIAAEATEVDQTGATNARIVDGMQFQIDDGSGNLINFEFNSGPEVNFTYAPGSGIFVRDGDTFLLDGSAFEFDTGSVIVVEALNGNGLADGETLTITDNQVPSVTRIFEFDDGTGGPIGQGHVRIPFNSSLDQAGIIDTIIRSINAVGNFNIEASLVPNSNRISLRGESQAVGVRTTSAGLGIQGLPGGSANLIPVEENMSPEDFGAAVAGAIPGAGAEGNRLNFSNFVVGSFPQIVSRGVFQVNQTADGSVTPNTIGVPFQAWDTGSDIAGRIADAINDNTALTANPGGSAVNLVGGAFFASADDPQRIGGTAPGGNFTGLAIIDTTIYGVTGPDQFGDGGGGLYRILNPLTNSAVADYVETSTDLLTGGRDQFGNPTGGPIQFASLTPGPGSTEDGRYAETLFGMDVWGNMYAMDLEGNLLPVFLNSDTSVTMKRPFGGPLGFGQGSITGFTFSTLDVNLWHVTDERREDDGHGWLEAPDGSRRDEEDAGNLSLRFGFNEPGNTPGVWGGQQDPGIRDSYDFPGGAHGTITSNTFSLKDYDESDSPLLTFNYFLDTEEAIGDTAPPPFMRDSMRVFISSDDGEWQLLATNNSFTGNTTADDEFDYGPFGVAELQDNVGWREAKVDLSPYGGLDNLRLRFDFNTAGSLDLGNPLTGGEELRAIEGSELFDGDTFLLQDMVNFGLETFEFDMGFTLNASSGSGLDDGQTITLSDGINAPVTLEFDLGDGVESGNVPVLYDNGMSATQVAMAMEDAILSGFGSGVTRVDLLREQNDTIAQPARAGSVTGTILGSGTIGDNPQLFGAASGRDVDMLEVNLRAGQQVTVDVDTDVSSFTALTDSVVRIFTDEGEMIASNDDGSAPNEGFTNDSYVEFTAPNDGNYYIAVSGFNNSNYDPFVQGSGLSGATGDYRLIVDVTQVVSPVATHLSGSRLNLDNVVSIDGGRDLSIQIDGAPGTQGHPVNVHPNMSSDEVAWAVREAVASAFGSGDPNGIPGFGDVVYLYGHQVIDPGPLGLSVTGFPLADGVQADDPLDPDLDFNGLDGDLFGAFDASTQFDGSTNNDFPGFLRGRDNGFEGAYVDDIVIGFSERGTMYTNVEDNTDTFSRVPFGDLPDDEILFGDYQIEFRASSFYGYRDPFPVETLILTEAYDPTQRLTDSVTIAAPVGAEAADGMTFKVGDGTGTVTLEYDNPRLRNGVTAGNIAVVVDPLDTAAQVANQIRDVINSAEVQAFIDLRASSREGSDSVELFGNPVVDTGTDLTAIDVEESNDVLSAAMATGIEPTGPRQFLGRGVLGDNPMIGAGLDVDLLKFRLDVGDRVRIDVDSVDIPVDAVLRLFDEGGNELAVSDDDAAPGEPTTREPYLAYTATEAGQYFVGISGYSNFTYDPEEAASGTSGNIGDYTVEIDVGATRQAVRVLTSDDYFGDQNAQRPQGQLVIHSNQIRNSSNYGVMIDEGNRLGAGNIAPQGAPRLLIEENDDRLAPGVAVKNNVIAYNRSGAISYEGDPLPAGQPTATVPFGRIVNNTLVGGRPAALPDLLENDPLGIGINLQDNATATILNNIIANFNNGILADNSSLATGIVVGGNLYQTNRADSNAGLGDFPIQLGPNDPLFVDRDDRNFNLAATSPAIDSSVDNLSDRQALIEVSQALGIDVSPILAPELDVTGQLRVDDPAVDSPSGVGNNVFKDRGAIDRADFLGPTASLLNPRDNDSAGADRNPTPTIVQINNPSIRSFEIQLNDGVTETGRQAGTGVDASTVDRQSVAVFRDDNRLSEGMNYIFSFDATSRIIRLTPLAGIWEPGRVYRLVLDGSAQGIRDLANNRLAPNQDSGTTEFTIAIGGEEQDFGDAPAPYPTLLLDNGASHVIDPGFHLGTSVDAEPNGKPSDNANADSGDNGVTFLDPLVPGTNARVRMVASKPGRVDAWLDFNMDGDWSDPGEQIFSSFAVSGTTVANVAIPETTAEGVSFARFRLSRDGGLPPTGIALNGEVEDYQVSFVAELPWHNSSVAADVDNDGSVIPMDALIVINELNNRVIADPETGMLPNPPVEPNLPETTGFIDVDADGFVSPRDALLVINILNAGAAEAEPVAARAADLDLTDAAPIEVDVATLDRTELIAAAINGQFTPRLLDDVRHASVDQVLSNAEGDEVATTPLELLETETLFATPKEWDPVDMSVEHVEETDFDEWVADVAVGQQRWREN